MAENLTNNEINFQQVLVIDQNGEQLGCMSPEEGIEIAKQSKLDLVCVSPNAPTPVCKIMNYGKFKFEQTKREKAAKKNQKVTEVSEVQFSLTTQQHDLETKANTVKRLIENKGNNVRVVLRLRGREMSYTEAAIQKMEEFVELCADFSSIFKPIKLENKDVRVILEKKRVEKNDKT